MKRDNEMAAAMQIPQLTREEYLDRVRASLPPMGDEEAAEVVQAIGRRIGTEADAARLRESLDAFLIDAAAGYAGLVEIYDIGHVRAALDRPGFKVENWHYDRTARALLINLRRGCHESLAGAMFNAYRARGSAEPEGKAAEMFVLHGMGWFLSSVSRRPLKGHRALDAQERMAFRGVDFRTLD